MSGVNPYDLPRMSDEPKTSEQPSGHLRWRRHPRTTDEPARLQQLWYITTYRGTEVSQVEEWRDVPFVSEAIKWK